MKHISFIFLFSLLLVSCARVGSPVGGPKDTIAPQFISSNIDTTRVNVSRELKELRLNFDEYVNLKDVSKNLIISPPIKKIKKILPSNLANKYILIQWEDTLQANTTYSFNFGNAIADNNEGNVLPYFTYAFSTGDKIDNLYIAGEVKDAMQRINKDIRTKETNAVVGLYKASDSVDYHQKPYYIAKVDPDGYYELNYLSPGSYNILAFEDANQNSIYDEGKESVGFQKEKIILDKNTTGLNLKLYPSKKKIRYLEAKAAPGGIVLTFEGKPQSAEVKVVSSNLTDYKVTHQPQSDSVRIWFDAQRQNIGVDKSDKIEFSFNADGVKKDSVSIFYRAIAKDEMTIENSSSSLLPPNSDFVINSNFALQNIQPEKWKLVSDSLEQAFTARIDDKNPFEVRVSSDFKEGKSYQLTVPKETVSSFYQSNSVSKRFDFEVDKMQNYGQLTLKLMNKPKEKFWIQLINESGEVKYSKFTDADSISFTEIKPTSYSVRILVDNNGNGIWDEADFYRGVMAEDVYLYPKELVIRPMWENTEEWDIQSNSVVSPTYSE